MKKEEFLKNLEKDSKIFKRHGFELREGRFFKKLTLAIEKNKKSNTLVPNTEFAWYRVPKKFQKLGTDGNQVPTGTGYRGFRSWGPLGTGLVKNCGYRWIPGTGQIKYCVSRGRSLGLGTVIECVCALGSMRM